MRTFVQGSGSDRKFVQIEVQGRRMAIVQGKSDGTTKRTEKELKDEAEAANAAKLMARELETRGFVEKSSGGATPSKPSGKPSVSTAKASSSSRSPATAGAATGSVPSKKSKPIVAVEDDAPAGLYDLEEGEVEAAPLLPRMAVPPPAAPADAKAEKSAKGNTKKKKKKRKKGSKEGDLDKRVIYAAAAAGLVVVLGLGFVSYNAFLKPAEIYGTWLGSKLEYEAGGPMSYIQYGLILDEQNRASMSIMGDDPAVGTFQFDRPKNLLKMSFKDEEGDTTDVSYRVSLGRATMDLFELDGKRKVVQLVRQREKLAVAGGPAAPGAPKGVSAPDVGGGGDAAADAALASVPFSPKDGAFKLNVPPGWGEPRTGSRPDNTYSWAEFTKGSNRIRVDADVAGSLMSGADSFQGSGEEGEYTPVIVAHENNKKAVSEQYSDFAESEGVLFKGSSVGEGRISEFTASGGGLFGSKIRGYRITLLTNNRRVTVLLQCPEKEFESMKPTFLAVGRSVGR